MQIFPQRAVTGLPSFAPRLPSGGHIQRLHAQPAIACGDQAAKPGFWMPGQPTPVSTVYTSERFSTANVAAIRNDARSLDVAARHLSGADQALKIFVLAQLVKRYPIFTNGQKTRADALIHAGFKDPQLAKRTFFQLFSLTKAPRARATARAVRFAEAVMPRACQGFEAADYAALREQIVHDLKTTPKVPSGVAADLTITAAICGLASRPRAQDMLRAGDL